jgi:hypothetical protein
MRKTHLILAICILFNIVTHAQSPAIQWARAIGAGTTMLARGTQIVKDASDNLIVLGKNDGCIDVDGSAAGAFNVTAYPGITDYFVAKYSSTGSFLWAKSISGNSAKYCTSIAVDNSGSIVLTGYYSGTLDIDPGPGTTWITASGGYSIFVAKFDASGNLIWVKNFQNQTGFGAYSYAIKTDNNDNIILCGALSGHMDFDPGPATATYSSTSSQSGFIAKYDSGGNYLWANVTQGPGTVTDKVIACDNLNNIFIGGAFTGTVDFAPGPAVLTLITVGSRIFLEKLDANGNIQYVTGTHAGNSINCLSLDQNKNILVTGFFTGLVDFDPSISTATLDAGPNGQDAYLAKYDSLSNYNFAFNLGLNGSNEGKSIAADASGDVYVTGYFAGPCDFDPSAATANLSGSGYYDVFIAKYSSSGAYMYAKKLAGPSNEEGNSLVLLSNGNIATTGIVGENSDFDPGPGTYTISPSAWNAMNKQGVFVAIHTQATASLVTAFASRDYWNTYDGITSIKQDAAGDIYVCGYFNGSVDVDISPATSYYLSAAGWRDGFVAKYTSSGTLVWARRVGGSGDDDCVSIALDPLGNCLVTGHFETTATFNAALTATATSVGAWDCFIMKMNSSGFLLWHKTMGTSVFDGGVEIATDASSNVYVTGFFEGTMDIDPSANVNNISSVGDRDIFLAKYDQFGDFVWGGGIGSTTADNPYSLDVDTAGNPVLVGTFSGLTDFDIGPGFITQNCSGFTDMFIAKYNSTGGCYWAHKIGGNGVDVVRDINIDPLTNNYYICGNYSGTVDFNPAPLATNTLNSSGGFVAKYDSNGSYLWVMDFAGAGKDVYGTVTDASSNVYVTGAFFGSGSLGGGSYYTSILADIFIAKYTASGAYISSGKVEGGYHDFGISILVDNANDIYVVGNFKLECDFDVTVGTYKLIATGGEEDAFIAKYKQCPAYNLGVASQTTITCNGGSNGSVTFTNTAGPGTTYSWTPGGMTTYSASGLTAGTYSVLAYSSCGLATSASVNVTQPLPINVFIIPSAPLCMGSTLVLQGSATTGVPPYTYTWNTGATTANINATVAAVTVYSLAATDNNGCYKSVSYTLNPIANPTVTITASSNTLCAGNFVSLTAGGANNYVWNTLNQSAVEWVNGINGSVYSVVGTSFSGCSDTETITLTVYQPPALTIQTTPSALCPGDSAILNVSGAQTYSWNNGSTTASISVQPPISSYTVFGQSSQGCTNSVVASPIVNPSPVINIVSSASILCTGNSATLNANGASSYTWDTGSSSAMIVVSPTITTTYTLQGVSSAGCPATATITQNVSVCTSLESSLGETNAVIIFPNPGDGLFHVALNGYDDYLNLDVENLLGQKLANQKIYGERSDIDLRNYPNGIYVIKIYKNSGLFYSGKVIKN